MKVIYGILVIALLFSGCMMEDYAIPSYDDGAEVFLTSTSAAHKGSIAEEAKLFTDYFSKEYDGAHITKIRWQLVDNGSGNSTYVIEGIKGGDKYILKLINPNSDAQSIKDVMVLGRAERPLSQDELRDGKPTEQALELSEYISVQKIFDIAQKEFDSTVQEWKLTRADDRQVIQVILWGEDFMQKIVVIDAVDGSVLHKAPQY